MSFRPIGNWIAVTTDIGGEKTTDAGVVYTDNRTGKGGFVWSKVHAVGPTVAEDIRPGDKIYWELASNRGNHYGSVDLVDAEFVIAVDRDEIE